jgi:Leucine-rich repeat (LRR) protein
MSYFSWFLDLLVSERKLYLKAEGHDCLKDITPIPNLTIDKSFTPEQEKQVLLNIYHTTNGQYWYNQSGWSNQNETSHCYWYGISCHNNTSYVKSIVLAFNNLDGFLPSHLWKLRNLLSLCTPGNPKLHGRMEDFIFANMSKIQMMIINGASINGRIPEAVGNLYLLQKLFACGMSGQGLSGNLPENLGNMTELWLVCLSDNSFTGQIPRSISKLKKLRFLDLRNAPGKMSGYIKDLFSIPALEALYISGITFNDRMPAILPKQLKVLVSPGNSIHGNLPKTYPKGLKVLNVANNKLTGDVPGHLFFLPHITKIDVSQNLFSSVNHGRAWSHNYSNSNANYISLAGNRNLSIDFQSYIDTISNNWPYCWLRMINVSLCGIKSPFPLQLLYTNTMVIVDLRSNKFYGSLPDILTETSRLTYLDVSFNHLSHDLPTGIAGLTSLQYLDISGNYAMRQGNRASKNVLLPDFLRMTRPPFGDNFTCPEARFTFNNGRVRLDPTFYRYKYCVCDSGFYGDSGLCKKCMAGGTCQQPVAMTTNDFVPNTMKIRSGYWPSPTADNVTHLVHCPDPKACNPFDDCNCRLETLRNDTHQTLNRSVSSLVTTCNSSCICHMGNMDRFCSRCKQGFYKTGGLCYPCPKAKDNLSFYIFIPVFTVTVLVMLWSFLYFKVAPKTAFIVVAVEFILILVFTLLEMMPAWVFKLDVVVFVLCMTNRGKAAHSLIKIGVFYIQTLDSMVSTVDVWPRQVFPVQHYIGSFWNLHFSSLSCEFSVLFNPVGRLAFVLLLPLVCMLVIGLYFVISIAYNKFKHQEDRIRTIRFKCRQLTMSCLNFTYFPIVGATVSVLRPCDSDDGILFMPKTPWIECSSQTYHVLSIMGWLSVVF